MILVEETQSVVYLKWHQARSICIKKWLIYLIRTACNYKKTRSSMKKGLNPGTISGVLYGNRMQHDISENMYQ